MSTAVGLAANWYACYRHGMEETTLIDPSDDTNAGPPAEPAEPAHDNQADNNGATAAYVCPSCGTSISLSEAPVNGLIECPNCGAQFLAASGEEDEAQAEERAREAEADKRNRETEFNETRIQQVKTLRRSLVRTRSYFVVATLGCAGMAAQLLWKAWPYLRDVRTIWAAGRPAVFPMSLLIAYLLAAVGACLGCKYFIGRVRQMDRELAEPMLTDPETPPDFSTLSDGSQQWRGLEQMHASGEGTCEGTRQSGMD